MVCSCFACLLLCILVIWDTMFPFFIVTTGLKGINSLYMKVSYTLFL